MSLYARQDFFPALIIGEFSFWREQGKERWERTRRRAEVEEDVGEGGGRGRGRGEAGSPREGRR